MTTRREILQILEEWNWKDLGLVDIKTRGRHSMITARVARRNGTCLIQLNEKMLKSNALISTQYSASLIYDSNTILWTKRG